MFSVEEVLSEFKKMKLKITPQRIETVRVLSRIGQRHPSLNDVLREVSKKVPTISFSTLWTIIKTLEKLGVVKTFDLDGETHVEINNKPHINIIVRGEREIRDLDDSELLEVIKDKLLEKRIIKGNQSISFVNVYIENS